MTTWLQNRWDQIRSSFWFMPTILSVFSIVLSFTMVNLDEDLSASLIRELPWLWTRGPEGALALLSTIAGSMITIGGVVFSITIVALTLASAQFGPRLLRNFMRDRGNQISLGTFIATFLYCLFIMRAIEGEGSGHTSIPVLSISVGLLLAVASLGVLIYFMHHVAVSIQAPHVVAIVATELHDAIERLFPEEIGIGKDCVVNNQREALPPDFEQIAKPVKAQHGGYVQAVDEEGLLELAKQLDGIIRLEHRPGQFVVTGESLALVSSAETITEEIDQKIKDVFILGVERTQEQDVEYAIHQLVEVAVRALSPGINDPFTAINCVDRLGEALCRLTQRVFPSPFRYDEKKNLRIIVSPVTFAGVTEAAFNQIRQHAKSNASVTIRLLETIGVVAKFVRRDDDRRVLSEQATMIKRGSQDGISEENDRMEIENRYCVAMTMLDVRLT